MGASILEKVFWVLSLLSIFHVMIISDFNTAENITELMVSEGFVTVRRESMRNSPEIARLIELEDAAKAAGKGKWGGNAQVCFVANWLRILFEQNYILGSRA